MPMTLKQFNGFFREDVAAGGRESWQSPAWTLGTG
jgi:hypothetical protein